MKRNSAIFVLIVVLLAAIVGAFLLVRHLTQAPGTTKDDQEKVVKELAIEDNPFVSLTPRTDGHEFKLRVTGIPSGVDSLEYELVYKNADGVTQGVPGTVSLGTRKTLERDLLLGSCSSGRCKYDEGVEDGTLTLRLRDEDGKLVAKLSTPFHLQQGGKTLSSGDGEFEFSSSSLSSGAFYITTGTFGLPGEASGEVVSGPYGIFTSGKTAISGRISLEGAGTLYGWNGSRWVELEGSNTPFLGTFIIVSSQ